MQSPASNLISRTMRPLQEFIKLEESGGLALMGAAAVAMVIANSPLSGRYIALLDLPVQVRVGDLNLAKPLLLWINDGLMAVFFLLVGMELKREVLQGHLSSFDKAILPAVGAVGGLLAPAGIYALLNANDPAALRGWAIPSATDIAFALGVLALVGDRVPPAIKAFLLSVAVFDDLGAIVIIAAFYTSDLSVPALSFAGVMVVGLFTLNRLGVMRTGAYLVLAVPLWVAVLKSGVHATLAGVVLALFIPIRDGNDPHHSPLHRLEHALHPWVAFGILPVFAFANAGVSLAGLTFSDMLHPVPLGIAGGLLIGKQAGIMAACFAAIKLNIAALPVGVRWAHLYGVALLCGVGFTMSLFVASLAFDAEESAYNGLERLGILTGSLISGTLGYTVLRRVKAA